MTNYATHKRYNNMQNQRESKRKSILAHDTVNKEERRGSGNRRTGGSLGMEMEDGEVKGSLYHYILCEYVFVQFLRRHGAADSLKLF